MPRYLVTGGAGFIGSTLAGALRAAGHAVVVADNLSTGRRTRVPPGCTLVEMDLSQEADYARLPATPFDAVCHLAAQSSGEASFADPALDFASHATATFRLLAWCRRVGVPRFLYASSMAVYGDASGDSVDETSTVAPRSYYAAGKLAAEAYVRLHESLGIRSTIFRMFSVYGPHQDLSNTRQGMVSIFLADLLKRQPVVVKGPLDRVRDFVFVEDVVDAWVRALSSPAAAGRTYNLGTGIATTVRELIHALADATDTPAPAIVGATGTPGDQRGVRADITRIGADLGWSPRVGLRDGLARMVASYPGAGGGA